MGPQPEAEKEEKEMSGKIKINRDWLERRMEKLGITNDALETEFGFAPRTITGWENGRKPRPYTLRKLAGILKIDYLELVRNLGVRPMSRQNRKARSRIPR